MPELFKRILLPVDFAPVSRQAFLLGLGLAHQFHAQVFLLPMSLIPNHWMP
jgi:hypothetical protein